MFLTTQQLCQQGNGEGTFESGGETAQEVLLIHAVLEGFGAIDKNDWNLVVVKAAQLRVTVNVHVAPGKSAATMELDQAFFHDFAKVAPLAGIHHHLSRLGHIGRKCSSFMGDCPLSGMQTFGCWAPVTTVISTSAPLCRTIEALRAAWGRGMSETILIADDHESSLVGLEGLLAIEGFKVVTATNGEAALKEFARCHPDLLLLDVQMPGLTGIEVCRRIKGAPDTCLTPVVLITGATATAERMAGIEAGADDFIIKPVDREQLLARVRTLLKQKAYTAELERAEAVLFALARAIEGKDPSTEGHCERLSDYSSRLGRYLGLAPAEVVALRRGGIVHDIGKVAVPDSILLKPGPLTRDEREVMRGHTIVGERICAPLKSFQLVLPIIRHHHERRDGSGYPDGLRGDDIPLTARILQIVDVYDALTTKRPYKRAMSPAEALRTMECEIERGWWDGLIFREFVDMLERDRRSLAGRKMAAAAD